MPEFLEDPSVLTKDKLKSELVANNVTLPAGEQRKDVYVQLYLQHLTARNRPPLAAGANSKGPPDFSSDEEREPTPVPGSGARGRAAVGRVRTPPATKAGDRRWPRALAPPRRPGCPRARPGRAVAARGGRGGGAGGDGAEVGGAGAGARGGASARGWRVPAGRRALLASGAAVQRGLPVPCSKTSGRSAPKRSRFSASVFPLS